MNDVVSYDLFSVDALVGLPDSAGVGELCSRCVLLGAMLSGIYASSVQPVVFDDASQLAREVLLASKSREESMTVLLFAGVMASRWRAGYRGVARDNVLFSEAVKSLGGESGSLVDAFGDEDVGRWIEAAAVDGGRILIGDASVVLSFGDGGLLDQARAMLASVVSGVCDGGLSDDFGQVFFAASKVRGEADSILVNHERFSRLIERFSEPCGGGGSFFVVFLFREFLRSVGLPVFRILSPNDVLSSFGRLDDSSGALFRVYGSRISMIDQEAVSSDPEVLVPEVDGGSSHASSPVEVVEAKAESELESDHESGAGRETVLVEPASTDLNGGSPVTGGEVARAESQSGSDHALEGDREAEPVDQGVEDLKEDSSSPEVLNPDVESPSDCDRESEGDPAIAPVAPGGSDLKEGGAGDDAQNVASESGRDVLDGLDAVVGGAEEDSEAHSVTSDEPVGAGEVGHESELDGFWAPDAEGNFVRFDIADLSRAGLSPGDLVRLPEVGGQIEVFEIGEGDVNAAIQHLSSVLGLGDGSSHGLAVDGGLVDSGETPADSSAKFRELEVGCETVAALRGRDLSPERIVEMMEEGGVFDHEPILTDVVDIDQVRPVGSSGWSRSKVSASEMRKVVGGAIVLGVGVACASTLLIGAFAISALMKGHRRG